MFYVYRNTKNDSETIGQFSDRDMALAYMEFNALKEKNSEVIGYAVRDFLLRTYAELEK